MALVELTAVAVADLEGLIGSHSLPADTRIRFRDSVKALEAFPLLGPALGGRWSGFRFVPGPWRWMIVLYVYLDDEDRAVVVTIQDGRSASFA